jgi:hypothetical protein
MTNRVDHRQAYVPRFPWWVWLGLASRNARRGIIFGAFFGLLIRGMLRLAVFMLRGIVRGVEIVFRVPERTAFAMVLSFLVGVLACALLLAHLRPAVSGTPHPASVISCSH